MSSGRPKPVGGARYGSQKAMLVMLLFGVDAGRSSPEFASDKGKTATRETPLAAGWRTPALMFGQGSAGGSYCLACLLAHRALQPAGAGSLAPSCPPVARQSPASRMIAVPHASFTQTEKRTLPSELSSSSPLARSPPSSAITTTQSPFSIIISSSVDICICISEASALWPEQHAALIPSLANPPSPVEPTSSTHRHHRDSACHGRFTKFCGRHFRRGGPQLSCTSRQILRFARWERR